MSTPDAYRDWLQHPIDEQDTAPLADHGLAASGAVGQTVQQVLSRCGEGCLSMELGTEGWVVIHWSGPSSASGIDQLLATVVAARRYRFRGWLHAVAGDGSCSISLCVHDGRVELSRPTPATGLSARSLQQLDILGRPDTSQEIPCAQATIEVERAPQETVVPPYKPPAVSDDPADARLSGAPARVIECVRAGGAAMPLEGQQGGQRWLLLERALAERRPILLGERGARPVEIDPLAREADVLQLGAALVFGGRRDVVRVDLDTGDRRTLVEARAAPSGMKLAHTAAGLAVGTGEGVLFVDPLTARLLFRFGHRELSISGLLPADDGALLFAARPGQLGRELFRCSPGSVTHVGTVHFEIVQAWRAGALYVRSYTETAIIGAARPWSVPAPPGAGIARGMEGVVRGRLTFPDRAALAAWRQVRLDPSDYDFLQLFPLRESGGELVVGEALAALPELTVAIDGPEIVVSGRLPDAVYLTGHREAHELCAVFWAAAEHGGRGDLFLFDISDDADNHWPCCWMQIDEAPRDVCFDHELGLELMTRGPELTRELIVEVAAELGRDAPDPGEDPGVHGSPGPRG